MCKTNRKTYVHSAQCITVCLLLKISLHCDIMLTAEDQFDTLNLAMFMTMNRTFQFNFGLIGEDT